MERKSTGLNSVFWKGKLLLSQNFMECIDKPISALSRYNVSLSVARERSFLGIHITFCGNVVTSHKGYLSPRNIQCHCLIIQCHISGCFSNRRYKNFSNTYIWHTFDLVVFKALWGPFGILVIALGYLGVI